MFGVRDLVNTCKAVTCVTLPPLVFAVTDDCRLGRKYGVMLTKDSRDRGRRMLADKQGAKAIAALISEAEGRTVTAKEIEALAPPKGVRSNHPPPR